VIDNGSLNAKEIKKVITSVHRINFISLPKNMGIAHAQNVGIKIAHELQAAFVLTLDQDSVPSVNMVSSLIAIYEKFEIRGRIAAIGPLLKDEHTELYLPFFSYSKGRKRRISPVEDNVVLDVEFLVSSGSLLAMNALKEVGLMHEALFISYVDVEWCLRAKGHGFQVLACCSTTMVHNLGDRRLKVGSWLVPLHSPLRHFYLMRSGILMQRLPHVPTYWKRADIVQLIRSFILFSAIGLPSFSELISMSRGLLAGLRLNINFPPKL
jgi:rhamnosyltransferase